MIVDDLNAGSVAFVPEKADAPLVVDSDAPLSCPVAGKLFQAVPRRYAEKVKGRRRAELFELALRDSLDFLGQPGGKPSVIELFGLFAGK